MNPTDKALAEVPIDWFKRLLEFKEAVEKNPRNLDYLIGYIDSAQAIIDSATTKALKEGK